MHSDSNEYSGGNTVWYNYTLASAGTIVNKDVSDTTGNITIATESVCPKGWTLPTTKQIDSNRNVANFLPVSGGGYAGDSPFSTSIGVWWGAEAHSNIRRERLLYEDGSLSTNYSVRNYGYYIRCVSEEKTVLDLTYMQDMTLSIS